MVNVYLLGFLPFLFGTDEEIGDQFLRIVHGCTAGREAGDEFDFLRIRRFDRIDRLDRRSVPDARDRYFRNLQLLAWPVRITGVQRPRRLRQAHGRHNDDSGRQVTYRKYHAALPLDPPTVFSFDGLPISVSEFGSRRARYGLEYI